MDCNAQVNNTSQLNKKKKEPVKASALSFVCGTINKLGQNQIVLCNK